MCCVGCVAAPSLKFLSADCHILPPSIVLVSVAPLCVALLVAFFPILPPPCRRQRTYRSKTERERPLFHLQILTLCLIFFFSCAVGSCGILCRPHRPCPLRRPSRRHRRSRPRGAQLGFLGRSRVNQQVQNQTIHFETPSLQMSDEPDFFPRTSLVKRHSHRPSPHLGLL